jgi:hypothetical protein
MNRSKVTTSGVEAKAEFTRQNVTDRTIWSAIRAAFTCGGRQWLSKSEATWWAYSNAAVVLVTSVAGVTPSTFASRNTVPNVGWRLPRSSNETKVRSIPASRARSS